MKLSKYHHNIPYKHIIDVLQWWENNKGYDYTAYPKVTDAEEGSLSSRVMFLRHRIITDKPHISQESLDKALEKQGQFDFHYRYFIFTLKPLYNRLHIVVPDEDGLVYLSDDEMENVVKLKSNMFWPKSLDDVMRELVAEVEELEQQCL